ncbi:MAG: retroviral-like aspartic protease family protein [Woeseiaceae bacterium]
MNRSFNILGIAAIVLQSGCATTLDLEGALAIAPYRIEESGRIVVEARINGQGPYGFALDTGSSITAVFEELRSELALQPIPGIKVLIHGAIASGKFDLLDIDRLEVGREVWRDPRIVSLPGLTAAGDRIGGVLGINFLRRYAVGFSSRDRVIRLCPPDLVARRAYRGWASVPLDLEPIGESGAALYFIDVNIDGWQIRALFDLGAGLNMINRPGAQLLGVTHRKLRNDELFSGALGTMPIVSQLAAKEVTTAGIRWRNEVFSIADLEVFEAFRLRDSPAAILGAGLFTQRDFIIDFARSRLLVKVAMKEVNEADIVPTMR